MPNAVPPPRWNLDSVFPGFDSLEFARAKARLGELAAQSVSHMETGPAGDFTKWLSRALELQNEADLLSRTLSSYCYAIYSTDTTNKRAMAEINAVDEIALPFAKADTLFLNLLAAHEGGVRSAIAEDPSVARYSFYLEDALFWQKKQMSAAEEDLAADLARSGADAWGRLQEQLTSTADCLWDESNGSRKTLVELRALAYDKSAAVREKAFQKELETCASIALPVAACLNGIKGTAVTLNARRHWLGEEGGGEMPLPPELEKSARQGRLSRKALSALITAMEESLPHWRRYLKAKARMMGKDSCRFPDLFAPAGDRLPAYSWEDVRRVVVENFTAFSPRMGDFARRAFDEKWIDAEPRAGKVSGAYCTDMPLAKETRVLANFDGAFNSVTTVAHELGHAFHFDVVKDLPGLQQDYPMTLAETASIFAETVVFESEYPKASPEEKLALLEIHLQDGCQIIVDILSRFYFERSVFEARKNAELTVEDLCAAMTDAQKKTYGDGLAEDGYHPYMWLVKCHYYSSDLSFYNFPYAFGQLFGMALYERYRSEGPSFAETYEELLLETGRMDAVSLTARAGFDIESPEFWKSGLDAFVALIDEFEKLAAAANGPRGER